VVAGCSASTVNRQRRRARRGGRVYLHTRGAGPPARKHARQDGPARAETVQRHPEPRPIGHAAGTRASQGVIKGVWRSWPKGGLNWAFVWGAGDENRTRTISLGTQQIGASDRTELGNRCTVSDRQGPRGTRANGPPMASGLMAGGCWPMARTAAVAGDRQEALWLRHLLLYASPTSVMCVGLGVVQIPSARAACPIGR
jgi:hypothetical protein